jgi:hypothetical protein
MERDEQDRSARTNAERQRTYRQRQANRGLFSMVIKGKNGYFDERIRIASGIKDMASQGLFSEKLIERIIEYSVNSIPPANLIDARYIRLQLTNFLKGDDDGKEY